MKACLLVSLLAVLSVTGCNQKSGNAGAGMHFFGKNRACIAVAITPDGRLVAGGGKGGTVELFDYDTRELIAELKGNWSYVLQLAVSPDGSRGAVAQGSEVRLVDFATKVNLRLTCRPSRKRYVARF